MDAPVPPFAPGESVKITFEVGNALHVHGGDFIKLDESGLLYQKRNAGPLAFIPRERLVLIEGRV